MLDMNLPTSKQTKLNMSIEKELDTDDMKRLYL